MIAQHDLGGDGPPLLVSHATGFHGRCYLPLAQELAAHFHCTAFDYRGHGDTPQPDAPVDWERYADDAHEMATALTARHGAPIDAFGHSMGGACLLMAALREPGLFRRLVVFEPIVFPPGGPRPNDDGEDDPDSSPMVQAARTVPQASPPESTAHPESAHMGSTGVLVSAAGCGDGRVGAGGGE